MKSKMVIITHLILVTIQFAFAEDGFENDFGEATGSIAVFFASLGFIYVGIRRAQVYSKFLGEDQVQIKLFIRNTYRQFRKPLLQFHYLVNIMATLTAAIHGILLASSNEDNIAIGWVAWSSMLILTISGIVIWGRFKPIWDFRSSRSALRYVHRQWLFTGIFLIALLIHVA